MGTGAALATVTLLGATGLAATWGPEPAGAGLVPAGSLPGLEPAAGVVLVLGVTAAWAMRHAGPTAVWGVALLVLAWVVPTAGTWAAIPAPLRSLVVAVEPTAVAGVACLAASTRTGRTGQRVRAPSPELTLVLLAVLVHALAYDAYADPGCLGPCEAADPPLAGLVDSRTAVLVSTGLTLLAATVGLRLLPRTFPPAPLTAALATALVLAVVSPVWRVLAWTDAAGRPDALHRSAGLLGTALVAAVLLAGVYRARRVRRSIEDLVHELESGSVAVGTGPVDLLFRVLPEGHWVDRTGLLRDPPAGRDSAVVLRDGRGEPVAGLPSSGGSDLELTPAQRVLLDNGRLRATIRSRIADVLGSRERIRTSGEVERRRIRRDLHDGAQQRLVSAGLQLGIAQALLARDPAHAADADRVDALRLRVTEALAALREITHDEEPR